MSQTLTKPVLLDETGRDISSKINGIGGKIDNQASSIGGKLDTNSAAIIEALDDIKDAIGTSSEFIPVMIKVVTPPTKTIYKVGEHLDLSGMVVNLVGTNGVQIDVTQACTFVPANGAALTNANTSVAITYHYAADNLNFSTSQALTIRELDSIAVTTPPIKTAYQTGETLDLAGIVVTATYSDGYTANVTSDCIFSPANGTVLSSSDTSVGVNYTEGGVTKSTSVAIGVKELVSIAVTHIPTKTSYMEGETLDLTGLVVTATYDDSSTIDITSHCVFNPADGATLSTSDASVSISITKTTSQVITVVGLLSIAITTAPTQTEYMAGEQLDLTGMVVTATYSDTSTKDVTADCVFNPADGTVLTLANTSVTVSYTEIATTKTTSQAIVVADIYGVEWDGTSSPVWTRTDGAANFTDPNPYYSGMSGTPSSPFDNIQPWAGMTRRTDANAGVVVDIPKYYYKWTRESNKMKLQISTFEFDGSLVSPAHADRGDGEGERDIVSVGAYLCSTSDYSSAVSKTPKVYKNIDEFRSGIHGLGNDVWQWDFAMWWTIAMLYLVEYGNWNSREVVGFGKSGNVASGSCDNMGYHTGTLGTSRNEYDVSIKYRNIENLWGHETFIDGIWYDNGLTYCRLLPSAEVDPYYYRDGTSLGSPYAGNGEITQWSDPSNVSGYEFALIPSSVTTNNNFNTYCCDKYYSQGIGGYVFELYGDGTIGHGIFSLYSFKSRSDSSGYLTSRLMVLPNS